MRISTGMGMIALCLALSVRADDTKAPQISEVRAGAKGGQVHVEARITDETGVLSAVCHHRAPRGRVEDSPMVKNDFDDVFRTSFPGGPDTEYWIEASDLLGNGPATYGTSAKAVAVGGAAVDDKAVSRSEAPPRKPREPKRPRQSAAATAPRPPAIEHSRPTAQPPEGRDFTVRMKIRSESPVAVAVLQARPQGSTTFINTPLTRTEGDSWEAQIPGAMAHGSVEYFIAAKNQAGQMSRQGDGKAPYVITFKTAAAAPAVGPTQVVAAPEKPSGPFIFTDNPPVRVAPGQPIILRAQVVPPSDNGEMPDRVAVLWRGNDGQDPLTDMVRDETGGGGRCQDEPPPAEGGAVAFQGGAREPPATRCGIDTGSRRKWHAAAVASQPGSPRPLPLDAVSTKAPPILPE